MTYRVATDPLNPDRYAVAAPDGTLVRKNLTQKQAVAEAKRQNWITYGTGRS